MTILSHKIIQNHILIVKSPLEYFIVYYFSFYAYIRIKKNYAKIISCRVIGGYSK